MVWCFYSLETSSDQDLCICAASCLAMWTGTFIFSCILAWAYIANKKYSLSHLIFFNCWLESNFKNYRKMYTSPSSKNLFCIASSTRLSSSLWLAARSASFNWCAASKRVASAARVLFSWSVTFFFSLFNSSSNSSMRSFSAAFRCCSSLHWLIINKIEWLVLKWHHY